MGFTIALSISFDGQRYFTSTEQRAPSPIQSHCGAIGSLEKWGGASYLGTILHIPTYKIMQGRLWFVETSFW
jgi:hypothetical protein